MTVRTLKKKQDELVLVPQDLAVLVRPWASGEATVPKKMFENGTLATDTFSDYSSLGELEQKAGVDLQPESKFSEIFGYGSRAARRRIMQSEGYTIDLKAQETTKITYEILHNLSSEDFEDDGAGGFRATKSAGVETRYWEVFVLGFDGTEDKPVIPWWHFPKMAIDKAGKQGLQMDEALGTPLSLSVFEDGGRLYDFGIGGAGWADLSAKAGFATAQSAVHTVTISGTPTAGTFVLSYAGVATSGIPYNASAATVKSALEALSSVGSGNVTVAGPNGGPWSITFDSALNGALTASGTNLTGGTNPAASVS